MSFEDMSEAQRVVNQATDRFYVMLTGTGNKDDQAGLRLALGPRLEQALARHGIDVRKLNYSPGRPHNACLRALALGVTAIALAVFTMVFVKAFSL